MPRFERGAPHESRHKAARAPASFDRSFFLETNVRADVLSTMLRALLLLSLIATTGFAVDQAVSEQVTELFKQRRWSEAETLLEKITVTEPDAAQAWYFLGQALLAQNNAEKAVPALEKAVALAPSNSEYQVILGDACGLNALKAGLFAKLSWAKKCKASYDKAIELDPKNIRARLSVMEFCRQAPGFLGGGMDKAYEQAAEIKKLDAVRGRQAYATLYVAEKKYPEAFAVYEDVLREKPGDDDALYNIGRLAAISGQQLDRGLETLKELVSHPGREKDARAQTRIGNILEKKGDKAGAKTAYETALIGDPKFVQALEALRKLNAS